jgi:hypothetical protein
VNDNFHESLERSRCSQKSHWQSVPFKLTYPGDREGGVLPALRAEHHLPKTFQRIKSRNFSSNFQKQGGDHSGDEDEDEKLERSNIKDRKDKRPPEGQYKEDDEDKTDQGSSDSESEDEEFRITLPTKKDLEKRYFLPPSFAVPDGKTETEMEIEIKEEGEEALPDEEEPIRREEGEVDIWINSKLRRNIQKRIRVLEQQQANGQFQANSLINTQAVKLNLLSQIHSFITECQKLINACPKV